MNALVQLPRSLVAVAERHGLSAVANARSAMAVLGAAVRDRRELTARLDADGGATAGALTVLDRVECLALLATCSYGRLAYIARRGVVDIAPVNYVLDGADILIRSGPGSKLQAAERREHLTFEVDQMDEEGRSGWSVVVYGPATRLPLHEARSTVVPEPWAAGPRDSVIRLHAHRVTGRRLVGA
jgi:uncharacterized protein